MVEKKFLMGGILLATASVAQSALAPVYQNARDLDTLVAFIKSHDRVLSGLRSIDLEHRIVHFGNGCQAIFHRKVVKRLPGWVGPVESLELVKATCPLSFGEAPPFDRLAGSQWSPVSIKNPGPGKAPEIFLQFAGNARIRGFSGCNRLMGKYQLSADRDGERYRLTIDAATTRMACGEASAMQWEGAFLDMLKKTRYADISRLVLKLYDERQHLLGTLKRDDFD